jgi:hypothetical protein
LPEWWKELLFYVFIARVIKLTAVVIKKYHSYKLYRVLFNIALSRLIIPVKLYRLVKMFLNEIYSKVYIGEHLCGSFLVSSDLKQDVIITTSFQLCFRMCHHESPGKLRGIVIEWDTSASVLC